MEVREAVNLAKAYFADLFAKEGYIDQGLEEVDFDEVAGIWEITIGFRRPLPTDPNLVGGALAQLLSKYATDRSYKIVRISDATGKVTSVKNHEIQLT